jgi:murein DD-endopeptidase MepM/ murein hydrolase activator NlpD
VIPAYRYDQGNGHDYFDDTGASLRKAFLKAPVEFSRISSRYNLKRFHPVLNRVKAHLGTDYAAPHGTPILAVGDGVVTKSGYTSGNGNYVKLRHNGTYETQYLHMSKRAVRVGESVRQGQVIGYVGATGLATGPHVCFRFWKNGKQVDHLREEFPPSEPIEAAHAATFEATVKTLKAELEGS